ncbi:hypothetical protein CBR_g4663 [Chara braunii]|uniref:Reverse transcriptase domain-containing protein n=1 Tax=Chara braunii TaxID=69332 RepID=A0A388KIF7_CHABU|nr:hypothetical protein CBR_g4663 [Chara braunii]|eukprot:GBG69835.1 hypothetical protein CBR_g4663 [Chara braunii]
MRRSNGEVGGISGDIEMASGVGDLEDRGRGDGLLEKVESVLAAIVPIEGLVLACEFVERDLANVLKVGLEGGAKDEDVIKVHDDTDFEEVTEDVVHGGLECGGGIGESERHYEELVVPEPRAECGLVGVLLADTDLVEATAEVDLGEIFGSTEAIKKFRYPGEWVLVLDRDPVQGTVVCAHAEFRGTVLLDEEITGSEGGGARLNESFFKEFIELALHFFGLGDGELVQRAARRRMTGLEINGVGYTSIGRCKFLETAGWRGRRWSGGAIRPFHPHKVGDLEVSMVNWEGSRGGWSGVVRGDVMEETGAGGSGRGLVMGVEEWIVVKHAREEVSKGRVGFVGEGGRKIFVAYSLDAGDKRKVGNDGSGEVMAEGADVLDEVVRGTGLAEVAELFEVVIDGFLGAEGGSEKVGPLEEGVTRSSGGMAVADFGHPPFGSIAEEVGGGNGKPVDKGHVVELERVLELGKQEENVLEGKTGEGHDVGGSEGTRDFPFAGNDPGEGVEVKVIGGSVVAGVIELAVVVKEVVGGKLWHCGVSPGGPGDERRLRREDRERAAARRARAADDCARSRIPASTGTTMATSSTMSQTSSQSTLSGVSQSGSQGSISQSASLRVGQQTQLTPEDYEILQAEELQDELQRQFDEAAERRRKAIMRKARLGVVEREVVHAIEVVPGSKVPRGRIYRMSPAELDELRRQLKELTEKGWIRPSTSPYGTPVLFIPKKGGTLRMCIDYRGLDAITVKNAEPLPRIDDLLDRVQGCRYFTKIDLKSGYHHIAIRLEDQHKTAFQTRYGLYEFVEMPFGLCNAPGTFQHAMNMICHDYLDKFIVVYLDDILIFSKLVEEHAEHLKIVLDLLRQHQYKVNLEKCEFGRTKILYLGHEISVDGLRPNDAKVASKCDWPRPQTVTEVRSFLGMTGYYHPL